MLEKEFKYYLDNQVEFVEKYNNMVIAIKDEKVIGVYSDIATAYTETKKDHELGTFLLQLVTSGSDAYTQTFHSRVVFN